MDVSTPSTGQKIKIQQLKPGMSLSSDVKDRSGRTLLRAGATLEEKHLKVFMTWGITEVEVVANAAAQHEASTDNPLDNIPKRLLEEARKEADRLFMHTDLDHPAMKELHQIAIVRIALGKTGGAGNAHQA